MKIFKSILFGFSTALFAIFVDYSSKYPKSRINEHIKWLYVIYFLIFIIWAVFEVIEHKNVKNLKTKIANYLSDKFICNGYSGKSTKEIKKHIFENILKISFDGAKEHTDCFAAYNLEKINTFNIEPILFKDISEEEYWEIAGEYGKFPVNDILMTLPQNPYNQIKLNEKKLYYNIERITNKNPNKSIRKVIILSSELLIEFINDLGNDLFQYDNIEESKIYEYLTEHQSVVLLWTTKDEYKKEYIKYGTLLTLGYNNHNAHKNNIELVLTPNHYFNDFNEAKSTKDFFEICKSKVRRKMSSDFPIFSQISDWENKFNKLGKL